MKKTIENEEALLNAFKIEELEERLEMKPWLNPPSPPTTPFPPF